MAHAKLSPSGASAWFICAVKPRREEGLPDSSSPASEEGTNGHNHLEALVLKETPIYEYPGRDIQPETIKMAEDCYAYALRRKKELKPAALRAESKVNPEYFTQRGDGSGTADLIICGQKVLEVIDLKTGGRYVDADDPQFKIYALGALADYYNKNTGKIPFETIRLTVFQPKRPFSPNQIERYIEMKPSELLQWCQDVYIPKAAATDDPFAVATPKDEACHFCKAREQCPEVQQAMTKHFGELFMNTTPNSGLDLLTSGNAVKDLSAEQISLLLDIAPMVKARLKDAEERAVEMLKNAEAFPHWKLVSGASRRVWAGDETFIADKCKELKIPVSKYAPRSVCSPAQMQKLGLPVEKWQALDALIEIKPGGLSLVPESDPRPDAIAKDPGFEAVVDMSFLN